MGVFGYYVCQVWLTILGIFADVGVEKYYCTVLGLVTLVVAARMFSRKRIPVGSTKIDHLPDGLLEDILSRVPATAIRKVGSVSTQWYKMSKTPRYMQLHLAKAARVQRVVVMHSKLHILRFEIVGGVEQLVSRQDEISVTGSKINLVHHCNGLILGITKDFKRFVIFNPCVGPVFCFDIDEQNYQGCRPHLDSVRLDCFLYAIGYEDTKSGRKFKVLRVPQSPGSGDYIIYNVNRFSSGRRFLQAAPPLHSITNEYFCKPGVSVNGNAYFFAKERFPHEYHGLNYFLVCYDFTREVFGPNLPLPFLPKAEDLVIVSSVGEEQLAVLFQCTSTKTMEIWVSREIGPEEVVWNKEFFLSVDLGETFSRDCASFFIDEEKNVAVVSDRDGAFVFGEFGFERKVKLQVYSSESSGECSYLPTLSHI